MSLAPGPAAVVLDVDGTLLDSNYQHVAAWWDAFLDQGHVVRCADVHRLIGRGSHDLVRELLDEPDDDAVQAVVDAHARHWTVLRDRVRPVPGAADLVRTCAQRGLRVVWASSGDEADVSNAREVLGVDDVVAAVVSSSDVGRSKPHPDVVLAALEAVGVAPERAVMVGDTVWDVQAARAAGVACIGVLAGGISGEELRGQDPAAVYRDCAELLDDLDASPVGRLL